MAWDFGTAAIAKHIDEEAFYWPLTLKKDVDGFHPLNMGVLIWSPSHDSTPAGIMEMFLSMDWPRLQNAMLLVVQISSAKTNGPSCYYCTAPATPLRTHTQPK